MQIPMRKPASLRWIERAEARRVLTTALSEAAASLSPPRVPGLWAEMRRRWAFASAPQQGGERRDAVEAAEIVDQVEDPLDPPAVEAGQRRQCAELCVDVGPGDPQRA